MLFSNSEEFGSTPGLNLIEGSVKKLPSSNNQKLPNIGWLNIKISDHEEPLISNIKSTDSFYHIHSFYAEPKEPNNILAKTNFFDKAYCSIAKKGNIFGCQFHPEKSGDQGLKIIKILWEYQIIMTAKKKTLGLPEEVIFCKKCVISNQRPSHQ